ncbi:polysaccharide biosynthesis tyrosine autokinase [Nocardioides cynanchi]|uniref:polysaccharide biosynthesis tyrosine autokinase n=1 Tax=Nocardioides cynanchi TaxID=2558918 RepID=UPI0017851FD5|nr:polysaccharide biosynthesis tyrosine autokinase [Nocardioides cynanchi]
MEFKDYVRIMRAHWVGVLVLVALGVLAATGYNLSAPKVYEASASGLLGAPSVGGQNSEGTANLNDQYAKSRVISYLSISRGVDIATAVQKQLGVSTSPSALAAEVSVTNPQDTVLLTVTAQSSSPQAAVALANAWVDQLAAKVGTVEGTTPTSKHGLRMTVSHSADSPTTPVLPRTKVNLVLGLLAGLMLGFVYALIRKQFDRRLRSTEEVEKQFGIPVIGLVPQSSSMRQGDSNALALAVTGAGSSSSASTAEAFRKLRTNLAYMDVDHPPRIIVVTSPKQSDGKSTVAANLAAAIAIGGQPVTLIDGDLRRPTVAHSLEMVDGAGLTDVLVGRVTAAEVMQDHPDVPGLRVLASGAIPPNPSELLGSQAMRTLITELAQDAMVIIDAPPLLPVTDAAVLTRSADGAIVVITHGGTLDTELTVSLNHISTVHGRTLGIVFNRMRRGASGGYYGDAYYRYEYQAESGKRRAKTKPSKPGRSGRSGHAKTESAGSPTG